MTRLDRRILSYVRDRTGTGGAYPTATEIERMAEHRDARHAVMSLAQAGYLARIPYRKPYAPHRYMITDAGMLAITQRNVA